MTDRTSKFWEAEAIGVLPDRPGVHSDTEARIAQVYATLAVAAAIREQTHVHTQAIIELLREAPTDAR